MKRSFACAAWAALLCGVFAPLAAAQARPEVAVLATAVDEGAPPELGPSLDAALRSSLDEADVVVRGEAALDMAGILLALGCDGATTECLAQVAAELAAERLVIPELTAEGEELVFEVRLFDASEGRQTSRAERRAPQGSAGQLLDATDALVREVFGIVEEPAVVDPPDDGRGGPVGPPDPVVVAPTSGPDGGRAAAAAVVLALGLAGVGVGFGFGADAQAGEGELEGMAVTTRADADRASTILQEAQQSAAIANGLFIAGGLVAGAGLVWLIAELASGGDPEPEVTAAPIVGDGVAGLTVRGAL